MKSIKPLLRFERDGRLEYLLDGEYIPALDDCITQHIAKLPIFRYVAQDMAIIIDRKFS